jgi:hypothetical protein
MESRPGGARAVAVLREPTFSPGMVERDAAILRGTAAELGKRHGIDCPVLAIEDARALDHVPDLVLSMAEGDDSLALLGELERRGAAVVNAPSAVRATRREALLALARPAGPLVEGVLVATNETHRIPRALLARGSVWIKRADYHALGPGDVARVDSRQVVATLRALNGRGIGRAVVQPHLEGPVVKFYGVDHERTFFRSFVIDGKLTASPGELEDLEARAFAAARAAGISVFGGDAVFSPGEPPVLIDLNAWPSFWRCLPEAAHAIADHAAALLSARFASRVA